MFFVKFSNTFSEGLAFSHGYSFGHNQTYQYSITPWKSKLISMIDRTLAFFEDPSYEKTKEIAPLIAKSTKFLNEHINTNQNIDELTLQFNVNSPINNLIKKIPANLRQFEPEVAHKIIESVDNQAGTSFTPGRYIRIGVDLFSKKSGFIQELTKDIGIEKTTNFVIFHEASHIFSNYDSSRFSVNYDLLINRIYISCLRLHHNEEDRTNLNRTIELNPELNLGKINKFIWATSTVNREIMADVGAILLQRNKDFKEGTYSQEQETSYVNSVINARNQELLSNAPDSISLVTFFDHFTSPGLEYLRDSLPTLPQRELTQEEIFNLSQKSCEVGLSRTIIASAMAHNENVGF